MKAFFCIDILYRFCVCVCCECVNFHLNFPALALPHQKTVMHLAFLFHMLSKWNCFWVKKNSVFCHIYPRYVYYNPRIPFCRCSWRWGVSWIAICVDASKTRQQTKNHPCWQSSRCGNVPTGHNRRSQLCRLNLMRPRDCKFSNFLHLRTNTTKNNKNN